MNGAKNRPDYFGGYGFAAGVVTGLRNWKIDALGRLTGCVFKNSVWTPGENHAKCLKTNHVGGGYVVTVTAYTIGSLEVPAQRPHSLAECEHGFYAYYDGSRDYHERGDVTGIIEGYGETIIGTKGFRCMKARIIALKPSGSITVQVVTRLQQLYPDVEFYTDLHKMLAAHPTDAAGMEYDPTTDPDFWTKDA